MSAQAHSCTHSDNRIWLASTKLTIMSGLRAPGAECRPGAQVRGERFSWEQARDMTFKDIAKNVEMYHAMLSRLFEQGAEDPESAAHAELVELLALKVCHKALCRPALPDSCQI